MKKRFFTLLELLVVIALIGIVSSTGLYLNYAVKQERFRNEVREITAKIKLAHDMVLNRQIPTKISFEKDERFYCSFDTIPRTKKEEDELTRELTEEGKKSRVRLRHFKKLIFSRFKLKHIDAVSFRSRYEEDEVAKDLIKLLVIADKDNESVGGDRDERIKSISFYPPNDLPRGTLAFYSKRKKKCEIALSGDFSEAPSPRWEGLEE